MYFAEGVGYREPRHSLLQFVDGESLESVLDEGKAKEEGGYVVKVVGKLSTEGEGQEGEELDKDDRERELEDVRKRVKMNTLVEMYARLLDVNSWYILPSENGVVDTIWVAGRGCSLLRKTAMRKVSHID